MHRNFRFRFDKVGGFTTPFAFTGIALVLVALVTTWLLPEGESMNGGDCKDSEGIGILQILKLPAVQLSALNIWMGTNSSGFLSATLEPHLRQVINQQRYNLQPSWGFQNLRTR